MKNKTKEMDSCQGRQGWSRVAVVAGRGSYVCALVPGPEGRIAAKLEQVGGRRVVHEYGYDPSGRLAVVRRDGAVTERYEYDARGRRSRDWNPQLGIAGREMVYGPDDRLLRAGDTSYAYDAMGGLERRRTPGKEDLVCAYTPLGFLGGARTSDLRFIGFECDGDERRTAKLLNNKKVEGYGWDRQGRLAWFFDVRSGATCWFLYAKDQRLPVALDRGVEKYSLGWDHVGSLRAVVDSRGRVVKEIDYDAFGNILRETNGELRLPFGFAGGLHDRDLGLVRFRFRDYYSERKILNGALRRLRRLAPPAAWPSL